MTRLEANREILKLLAELVEKYPDQRFVQLLVNTNVVIPVYNGDASVTGFKNSYQTESADTLVCVRKSPLHGKP
jgi:hypothetical protein